MDKLKRISFLFGSGISIPLGLPNVNEITEKILADKNLTPNYVIRNLEGNYTFARIDDWKRDEDTNIYVKNILCLIRTVKDYLEINSGLNPNYEDIFYILSQIKGHLNDNNNPAMIPFIKEISDKYCLGSENIFDFKKIVIEAYYYIHDLTEEMLRVPGKPDETNKLRLIKEIIDKAQDRHIDIFTLNHDLVLEEYLKQSKIQFIDGFHKDNNKTYDSNLLYEEETPRQVRLVKLHGSVDWYRMMSLKIEYPLFEYNKWDRIGEPCRYNQSTKITIRPLFLVGAGNKLADYTLDIFLELYRYFKTSLKYTYRMVVSGYGFRDTGINDKIYDWLLESKERKLIIIDPSPEKIYRNAPQNMIDLYNFIKQEKKGRVKIIKKGFEETDYSDVKMYLS